MHFNSALKIWVKTDTSIIELRGILSQLIVSEDWHSVTFWSRELSDSEIKYETHNQKLLVIIMMFK